MWSWFKKVATESSAPPEHPYYGARITVDGQKIFLRRNNGDNRTLNKKAIIYICTRSIRPEKEDEYWVDLYPDSGSRMSVTSRADGLTDLEHWMYSLDHFNHEAYESNHKYTSKQSVVLWKAPVTKTASLVKDIEASSFEELKKGLCLEKRDEIIPWGTFGELAAVSGVERSTVALPNPDYTKYAYTLHDVQILNGLQLETLHAQTPAWAAPHPFNNDWPVTDFTTTIQLGESAENDYERIKNHISQYWGDPDYQNDLPSSRETCWNRDHNKIELHISRLSDLDVYRPGCWMKISHKPDTDRFYTDDYQQQLQLHDQLHYTILDVETDIVHSYVSEKQARYTPSCFEKLMSSKGCFLVWHDEKHRKIGFGNAEYCQIYDEHNISGLTLVKRYWRDNPSSCSLYANLDHSIDPNKQIATFKTDDIQQWQEIKKATDEITQKPLNSTEDRQYY